jgi:hypothetical protein
MTAPIRLIAAAFESVQGRSIRAIENAADPSRIDGAFDVRRSRPEDRSGGSA